MHFQSRNGMKMAPLIAAIIRSHKQRWTLPLRQFLVFEMWLNCSKQCACSTLLPSHQVCMLDLRCTACVGEKTHRDYMPSKQNWFIISYLCWVNVNRVKGQQLCFLLFSRWRLAMALRAYSHVSMLRNSINIRDCYAGRHDFCLFCVLHNLDCPWPKGQAPLLVPNTQI